MWSCPTEIGNDIVSVFERLGLKETVSVFKSMAADCVRRKSIPNRIGTLGWLTTKND